MSRHSLWFVPGGSLGRRLAQRITAEAGAAGGPAFTPHVTLLGGIDGETDAVTETARSLATRLRPIEIHLGRRGAEDHPYRAFFLHVGPKEELGRIHDLACAAYGCEREPFLPHLSLRYGSLDHDEREARLDRPDPETGTTFVADALHLWSTAGNVADWHELARLPFGG